MWMKLILLLFATVCSSAGYPKKRSSVLTDESKRILDIFDFSNFDKQEALSYIDRQRFENLIRGKRSKWNVRGNVLKTSLSSGDGTDNEYSGGELRTNDEMWNSNSMSDLPENEGESFELCPLVLANHAIGTRYARRPENSDEKASGGRKAKDSNKSGAEEKGNRDRENNHKNDNQKQEEKKKKKKRHHWNKWTEWSPCSVTCGRGRKIRSRKCIAKVCASGEIEMGEKTCQLPACSLFDKLFSFFSVNIH